MTPRTAVLGMALLGLVAVPSPTAAQVHGCDYCHNLHGGGFQALNVRDLQVDLCQWCHDPDSGGPTEIDGKTIPKEGRGAPANSGFADHIGVRAGDGFQPSCWDCHNHEGEAGGNLVLIQAQMPEAVAGADLPVLFNAYQGTNSFADDGVGSPGPFDGVCQVCHQSTAQHNYDGAGNRHNARADCTLCHTHDTGFEGVGACTTCHNSAQDQDGAGGNPGRREVVSEFSRTSHHADAVTDADCEVCHAQNTATHSHQDGKVTLKNADNSAITYELSSYADPATDTTESKKLTGFCLSCHDADAAGGTLPFSDGQTPPPIDNAAWVASSHEKSVPIAGCFGNGTGGCHATGHGSQKANLLGLQPSAPADSGVGSPNTTYYEEEGFCFNCHRPGGAAATKDMLTRFSSAINWVDQPAGLFASANLNDRHDVQYQAQAQGGIKIECTDCHDPHVANAARPYRLDPDPTDGHVPGTDWYFSAYQTAGDELSEFCLDCHDQRLYRGSPVVDSVVNIRTTWVNDGMGARVASSSQQEPGTGWAIGDVLPCAACHSPHPVVDQDFGITNFFALVDTVRNKAGDTYLGGYFERVQGTWQKTFAYGINSNTSSAAPVTDGGAWCNTCHNRTSMVTQNDCWSCHRHGDGSRW